MPVRHRHAVGRVMMMPSRSSDLMHLARVARAASLFRIVPFSWRRTVLLLVSVFDVLLYATALSIVLSTIFSLGGMDRFILLLLGLIVMRWSLGCAVQASRLSALVGVCRPFLRFPVLSTAIIAMGHPTIVFALSWGLLLCVLVISGVGDSSPAQIAMWGALTVVVQASWNFLLILAVIYARTRRWFVSEVPIFFGFVLFFILSPVVYQFSDLPFTASRILTSFNPGSHLIAAYHNAMWYGILPSLKVLPWTVLLVAVVSFIVLRARFWPRRPAVPASFAATESGRESLALRSGLWLHDHNAEPGEGLTRFGPWRGELPWMSGRELLRLLFHDPVDAARAVQIFIRFSPRDQEGLALDLPLPVFPDRIRDRLCCAAALAKPGGAFLDQLLDQMEPNDILELNRNILNLRADVNAPLVVRTRAEITQHLIRARD
jgi:hypothetical protein